MGIESQRQGSVSMFSVRVRSGGSEAFGTATPSQQGIPCALSKVKILG